jgi:ribonucleoside-triphosphate reductase
MRTVEEIDADIARVRSELQDVHGTTTEVYARIVGYYRSVRNWNKGKREEYGQRKLFLADGNRIAEHLPAEALCSCKTGDSFPVAFSASDIAEESLSGGRGHYELFTRKTCPNCPPVKECCAHLDYDGTEVDVDSAEGFARASALGVFSAPTVVFFDAEGNELRRAHSVKEIHSVLETVNLTENALFAVV